MHYKALYALLALAMLCSTALALSPNDATNFVAQQNNFLMDEEQAMILEPQVMINYSGADYWVVAAVSNSSAGAYFPIKNSTGALATGDVEVRRLIETEIALSQMNALRNKYSAGSWPFSYSKRTNFSELKTGFNDLATKTLSVQTELSKLSGADAGALELLAEQIQGQLENLSDESDSLAALIEKGRAFEDNYFVDPDTNETTKYENTFQDFFNALDDYKASYNAEETKMNELKQGIASLVNKDLDQTQKNALINSLKMSTVASSIAATLPSFFSETEQTKTLVEGIFTSARNVEGFVANLETRKLRNDAWKIMYGSNDKILAKNSNFNTLSAAAEAILSEDNIAYWADQESVDALKINWTQAKTHYNNTSYLKAKEFAAKAEKNALAVLEAGGVTTTDDSMQGLLIPAIAILIVAVIGLFVFEKFFRKKGKGDEEEGYENERMQ